MKGDRPAKPHPVAFALVSALLVLSAVVSSRSGPGPETAGEPDLGATGVPAHVAQRVVSETARLHTQVELAARRFLVPFFRYEVGDIDVRVRRELHATATPEFAAALLAIPPRARAGGFPPRARLQSLEVNFSPAGAFHAFVDGAALRGRAPEDFSFEFEYSPDGWRASGVTG